MPKEAEPEEDKNRERCSREDRQLPVRGSAEEPRKICAERFEKEGDREGRQEKKKIDHREDI